MVTSAAGCDAPRARCALLWFLKMSFAANREEALPMSLERNRVHRHLRGFE